MTSATHQSWSQRSSVHAQNPLSGYQTLDGEYSQCLSDLQGISRDLAAQAASLDAHIVVNVTNLRTTNLAGDVGSALAEVLAFEREIVLDWDQPEDWFTQAYCLIFRPRPSEASPSIS